MNNLRPYEEPHVAPLTGGARFIRGFRRIGATIAALAAMIGVGISVFSGLESRNSLQNRYLQAACIESLRRNNLPLVDYEYDKKKIDLGRSGCPNGPMYAEIVSVITEVAKNKPAPLEGFLEPAYIGLLITIAVAASIYWSFWLFGWICAGFTRD